MGGRFKREKTYLYIWLVRIDIWQTPTQHCKAIILQLKINRPEGCDGEGGGRGDQDGEHM